MWRREAEEFVETIKPLRSLVIVRAAEINPPVLTGEQFIPGYFGGEAFCFELEKKRLIAAFPFAATNSDEYKKILTDIDQFITAQGGDKQNDESMTNNEERSEQ